MWGQIAGAGTAGSAPTDGITLVEGTNFTAGATFTVDPAEPRHRHIRVQGSVANSGLLTASMTVTVAPASAGWSTLKGQAATVIVEKGDTSAFTVTVLGANADGLGTRQLRVRDEWAAMVRRTGPGGPGPSGELFVAQTGGVASQQAQQERLIIGASTVSAAFSDLVPVYDSTGVFRGVAPTAALPIPATGAFNPASISIDAPRHYSQYTQTGAVTFTKNGAGTFRGNVLQEVLFNSNAAALSWGADFEDYSTLDIVDLPASLPAGIHRIVLTWNIVRSKIGVSFPRVLAEQINGTLNGVLFGSIGLVVGNSANRRHWSAYYQPQHRDVPSRHSWCREHLARRDIQNWVVGAYSEVMVDYKQDGTGGRTVVHPTGTVWVGGTPTFTTTANATNRVIYTTFNAGTSIQARYQGAY